MVSEIPPVKRIMFSLKLYMVNEILPVKRIMFSLTTYG